MKTMFIFILMLSASAFALEPEICGIPGVEEYKLPSELEIVHEIAKADKRDFIARTATPAGGWSLGFNILSNFKIPFVGSQNYFARIYFKKGEPIVRYRDEMIARDHYRDESQNPRFYNTHQLTVARMNRPDGYEVSTGVRLYGRNFNTNTGGRLTIAIKPPGGSRLSVPVDITVVNNRPVTAIQVGSQRVVFDTLKINADGGSILSGLDNIQLIANGRVVHTITN